MAAGSSASSAVQQNASMSLPTSASLTASTTRRARLDRHLPRQRGKVSTSISTTSAATSWMPFCPASTSMRACPSADKSRNTTAAKAGANAKPTSCSINASSFRAFASVATSHGGIRRWASCWTGTGPSRWCAWPQPPNEPAPSGTFWETSKMQVVMCEAYGGPESLVIKSMASPSPGPTEIKIRLRARGVSYTDVLRIAGQYHVKTPPPFVPGGEAAGEIVQLGCEVKGFNVGDRVLCGGGFAEETVAAVDTVIKLPDTVDFKAASAFRSNSLTAYYVLQRGRLRAGETLLVHGAAGGVGLATVDMGKLMGARVIATARSPERLEVCKRAGADHTIDYSQGFRDKVLALTGGRGANVIFDPVGGDVFDESMRCVAPFGRILIVGFAGGRPGLAKTNHLLVKDAEVIGFTIGALSRLDPARAQRNLDALVSWLGAKRISPHHSHALPLAQAADALKLIIERKVVGKVLLL